MGIFLKTFDKMLINQYSFKSQEIFVVIGIRVIKILQLTPPRRLLSVGLLKKSSHQLFVLEMVQTFLLNVWRTTQLFVCDTGMISSFS